VNVPNAKEISSGAARQDEKDHAHLEDQWQLFAYDDIARDIAQYASRCAIYPEDWSENSVIKATVL
jgi:hypothetical protein